MRSQSLSFVFTVIITCLPSLVTAAEAPPTNQSFQTTCFNAWMGRINDMKAKIDYQNFGDKYCKCAASQMLDTPLAIEKASQVCLSRTLLHDTMDALESDLGLSEITPGDIKEYCEDRWSLIYPHMNAKDKQSVSNYCGCAKPKLHQLVLDEDKITPEAFALQIDGIATQCASKVKADETTTHATP